jgi:hypothetical protein
MPNLKISQLPDASTPLTGTELIPLVQTGSTKKTTLDNLPFSPPGTGAIDRSIQSRLSDTISAKDFGVVGDGITDDTVNMQKAIDYAVSTGKTLFVPSGKYRMTAQLNFSAGAAIEGDAPNITTAIPIPLVTPPTTGTWFYLDHTGIGFFCRDSASVGQAKRFVNITNIGTYRPNQPLPAPGWTPLVCGEDIRVEYDVQLYNIVLLNPYVGIYVRSAGTLNAQHIMGQPLYTGILCERSSDVQYWNEVQWWPFWSQSLDVITYTVNNAVGFRITRSDGLYITNSFSIYYNRFLLARDVSGAGSGFASFGIIDCYSDGCGGGIEIISDYYTAYGNITNFTSNSNATIFVTGDGISLSGTVVSQLEVSGLAVTRANDAAVRAAGAAHTLNVSAIKVQDWDRNAVGGVGAFVADGSASINIIQIPTFSSSPATRYQTIGSGIILFPVRYSTTSAANLPTGIFTRRFSINNDTAVSINLPTAEKTVIMTMVPAAAPSGAAPAGDVWLRCTATPASAIVAISPSPAANFAVTTGVLTGTTGSVGDFTVSAASDGNIYLENRTGVFRALNVLLTGN